MPVALIYDSDDENFASGSHYFSGFSQVLVEVVSPTIFVGSFLEVTAILELLIADSWQGFVVFRVKYPIVDTKQNILLDRLPGTSTPSSRIKLLIDVSEDVGSIKAYVFC